MKATSCYGTRPEAIKLAPVEHALRDRGWEVESFYAEQQKDLLGGEGWSSLHQGIAQTIADIGKWGEDGRDLPDVVLVAGDAAVAFSAAVASYLRGIPVAHIEAGLRTYRRHPFPEESFRGMIARVADFHFAPDSLSADAVQVELLGGKNSHIVHDGLKLTNGSRIYITGNPVIDSLPPTKVRVLVTLHRRENWGENLRAAVEQLVSFSFDYPKVEVDVVTHPNWNQTFKEGLPTRLPMNIAFLDPLSRTSFLKKMQRADVIITDSGGVQEEAAHFGKKCFVMREETERKALLFNESVELLQPTEIRAMLKGEVEARRAYGEGDAGVRIAEILTEHFKEDDENES